MTFLTRLLLPGTTASSLLPLAEDSASKEGTWRSSVEVEGTGSSSASSFSSGDFARVIMVGGAMIGIVLDGSFVFFTSILFLHQLLKDGALGFSEYSFLGTTFSFISSQMEPNFMLGIKEILLALVPITWVMVGAL